MNETEKILTTPDKAPSPENAGQEEDHGISPELQAWSEKVLKGIARMAVDEEYRKQVSSFLP